MSGPPRGWSHCAGALQQLSVARGGVLVEPRVEDDGGVGGDGGAVKECLYDRLRDPSCSCPKCTSPSNTKHMEALATELSKVPSTMTTWTMGLAGAAWDIQITARDMLETVDHMSQDQATNLNVKDLWPALLNSTEKGKLSDARGCRKLLMTSKLHSRSAKIAAVHLP